MDLFRSLYGDRFEFRPARNMYYTRTTKQAAAMKGHYAAVCTWPRAARRPWPTVVDAMQLMDGPSAWLPCWPPLHARPTSIPLFPHSSPSK